MSEDELWEEKSFCEKEKQQDDRGDKKMSQLTKIEVTEQDDGEISITSETSDKDQDNRRR